ncbi:DsbA family oxidoreductase [Spongiactinospora rosea]|uniref:DsbA family oxidoreductase n=1 Tax=Spongiactinospora rosea TaxID=2248750 RepID=A0A366M1U1_9ACTN|nr:DsbA family oxidoreductase [Spongiactinospora rosea]RBQ20146.1 DsbA family oxidoreductase [Spongiactinospora rosea]
MDSKRISVEIWTDVVCPWCYLGRHRFQAALAGFGHRDRVDVRIRSLELDPTGPRHDDPARPPLRVPHRIQRDLGLSPAQADEAIARLDDLAAESGLRLNMAEARPVNSFDAHRLIHLAAAHDRADALWDRLMRAFATEGALLSDHDTLTALALSTGLPPSRVHAVLAGDEYADAVRADTAQAHTLGITGAPSFVFQHTHVIAGAQPPELFADLLQHAWKTAETPAIKH